MTDKEAFEAWRDKRKPILRHFCDLESFLAGRKSMLDEIKAQGAEADQEVWSDPIWDTLPNGTRYMVRPGVQIGTRPLYKLPEEE